MEDDFRGPAPVNLVLPTAPKDYMKLELCIAGIRANIDVETIHIITPTPEVLEVQWPGVVVHADADVLPYDRKELRHRPNWLFQMVLEVFQDVTEHEWFILMDADVVACNKIPLWASDGRPVFCLGHDRANWEPYWRFNQAMLGFGKVYPRSFLTECCLYNKRLVREMIAFGGFASLDDWWRKCVEITSADCHMADAELYGSYVYRQHPELYEYRQIQYVMAGRVGLGAWTPQELARELAAIRRHNPQAHLVALHTWADWEG